MRPLPLARSPAVGDVSAVTNNGDGSYSATYTSGSTAGNVTLTATATNAGVSGTANIVINAGPPAAIALSAAHTTVTSLDSTTITAVVTDSNGNGVGGLSLTLPRRAVEPLVSLLQLILEPMRRLYRTDGRNGWRRDPKQ